LGRKKREFFGDLEKELREVLNNPSFNKECSIHCK
jgi:hypothetical protein